MEITKYSKEELASISKILKKYRALRKNVGKKSSNLIHHELSWENKIIIEYFPSLVKSEITNTATNIYKNIFWIEVLENQITWKENPNLAWWMRLFLGDDMLDISFESVRNNLRKI